MSLPLPKKPDELPASAQRLLSGLEYCDYLLLGVAIDAEWTRRCPATAEWPWHVQNHRHFRQNAIGYGEKVNSNYKAWCQANGVDSGKRTHVKEFLFNTISYFPLGHADDACFVLLDDQDPIRHLTMRVGRKVEDVCVAYCPRIGSIAPAEGLKNPKVFVDLDTLPNRDLGPQHDAPQENSSGSGGTAKFVLDVPVHQFQRDTPLMVFAKFRLDGLLSLGEVLLSEEAVLKLMVRWMDEHITDLRSEWEKDNPSIRHLFGDEDDDVIVFRDVRCCLIDTQRMEEIGVLFFCRNYSLAFSLIHRLRMLRFKHLFEGEGLPDLRDRLKHEGLHEFMASRAEKEDTGKKGMDALGETHVFRWSTSTLYVAPHVVLEEDTSLCQGWVDAELKYRIAPGHFGRVERKLDSIDPLRGDSVPLDVRFRMLSIGDHDHCVSADRRSSKDGGGSSLVRLQDVLRYKRESTRQFTKRDSNFRGRDVVDCTPSLAVPVPVFASYVEIEESEKNLPHFSLVTDLLQKLQEKLSPPMESDDRQNQGESELGSFPNGLRELCRKAHVAGLPLPLRSAIESLYQMFYTILADPFLFDSILDLYDVFAALHSAVAVALPESVKKEAKYLQRCTPLLDERRTEQIAELVEAMNDAVCLRLQGEYPVGIVRDMAIMHRGGLNQTVLAGTAPIVCGLGLLRHHVAVLRESHEPLLRSCVGVVSRTGTVPGARCHSLDLRIDWPKLAFFEVDESHTDHVASYCDYLHEAFHLVHLALCDFYRKSDSPKKDMDRFQLLCPSDESLRDDVGEVFAILMTQVFVFGADREACLLHSVASYSRDLASAGRSDTDLIVRFAQIMPRFFMAYDALRACHKPEPIDFHECLAESWNNQDAEVDAAERRFLAMLEEAGPYYSEYERLFGKESPSANMAMEFLLGQFRYVYPALAQSMSLLWNEARTIYHDHRDSAVVPRPGQAVSLATEEQIAEAVRSGLEYGRPFLRCGFRKPDDKRRRKNPVIDSTDIHLDSLYSVACMLREYIRTIVQSKGRIVHLYRNPKENGQVEYPKVPPYKSPNQTDWHEFQMDPGMASLFCPVPTARRLRLKKQIALLKSFWSISSTLRARRLHLMFKELEEHGA